MHGHVEFPVWRLCDEDEYSLGLSCTENGLSLGGTPLLDKAKGHFIAREREELERLLSVGYGVPVDLSGRMARLRAIAKALDDGELCRATISAVMLQLPDLPSQFARHRVGVEDRLLKIEQDAIRINRRPDIDKSGPVSFDPDKHPRWPRGISEGGEFRPSDESSPNGHSAIHQISDEDDRFGIGGNKGPPWEESPEIPQESPVSNKVRNVLVRSAARWLARVLTAAEKADPEKRTKAILALLAGAAWMIANLPDIASYLDSPKDLKELQDHARGRPEEGYEDHHIVEGQYDSKHPEANSRKFSGDQLEGQDNIVRIPRLKHIEISSWYSKPNEDYGWKTPRDYLRGKSWEEQYQFGLKVLRKFGVLK